MKILWRINKSSCERDVLLFDEPYESLRSLVAASIFLRVKARKYLVIHDVNKWLMMPTMIPKKFFFEIAARRILLSFFDGIVVISPVLKDYIERGRLYKKTVFVMPFSIPKETEFLVSPQTEKVVFAVPGSVNSLKRDYNLILDVFSEIWAAGNFNIVLKVIGNVGPKEFSHRVVERFNDLKERFGPDIIKYWDTFLSNEQFVAEVQSCDVILPAINKYCHDPNHHNVEIYGVSKDTGTTYLLLKYAKPAIISEDFPANPCLLGQVLKYHDHQTLKGLVLNISNGSIDLSQLKEISIENSRRFMRDMQDAVQIMLGCDGGFSRSG